MESIKISVGYEYDNTYEKLNKIFTRNDFVNMFEEEIQEKYPYLFHNNGNGKCIHASITSKNDIEEILRIAEKQIAIDCESAMSLSLLWNFPRKRYNENLIWACLSGFFYKKEDNRVGEIKFVVSDNVVSEEDSLKTDKIIEYINKCV